MTTPDLIEKVARAIVECCDAPLTSAESEPFFGWEDYTEEARAAIETVLREMVIDASMAPSGVEYQFIKAFAKSHAITLEDNK